MAKISTKKWTVLYYANGNNEYEPEMYKSLKDLESSGTDDNINIVMQLGREERRVAEIIRKSETLLGSNETWTGVRRYLINRDDAKLISNLDKINMADPKNLYEFIRWGIENYPAKHYMLVLGGHGASFVGTITDYSQSLPYIMGTAEMCEAINLVAKDTKAKIDILVLDICYMNLVEIMYELGREIENTVQNVITYVGAGPLSGLPYDKLITILKENICVTDAKSVTEKIVNTVDLNLVGIEINHGKLKRIKKSASDLAYLYLNSKGDENLTPFELLTVLNPGDPWHESVKKLQSGLSCIVLCFNERYKGHDNLVNIMYKELESLIKIYYKLSFAKNNYWVHLLNKKAVNDSLDLSVKKGFHATVIRPDGLRSLIQAVNPTLDEAGVEKILEELISNRKWSWDAVDKNQLR